MPLATPLDARFPSRVCPALDVSLVNYVTSFADPARTPNPCMLVWNLRAAKRISWGFFVSQLRLWLITVGLFFTLAFGSFPLPAQVSQKPPAFGIPQASPLVGDTSGLAREAQQWLVDLVKINTTNPPGNEKAAATYIAAVLEKEGIHAELLDLGAGRSAIVARLRSTAIADPSRALLLVAHIDVVGVDREKWTVDPFGGVIKDGYLWGRGSIDDKSMLAANLAALIALKRGGVHLNRDVIFLGTADEEQSGDASLKIVIAKYWDRIAAGYALNEGGQVVLKDGKVQYVAVQVSEKVSVNVNLTATGIGGHASTPTKVNPVVHLAAAVDKVGNYTAPVHLTSIVRRYFEGLAPLEDEETSKWMRVVDTPDRGDHAQRYLSEANPMWNSMMRDTVAPTMLEAGIRANVIPSEAHATLNIRLVPGDTIDLFVNDLKKLVNDPHIRWDISLDGGFAAPNSSLDTDFYALITKATAQEFGGAPVLPFMSTGATDSAQLRLHNVQAYGLRTFPLAEEDMRRVHGDDERLPLASFAKGLDCLVHIVAEFSVNK